MNISTSKKATIAQSILLSLTGGSFAFRTLGALAKEAGASEYDTQCVADSMGLKVARRRSDGAKLYGIEGRVTGRDQVHTPVRTEAARPAAAAASSGCCTTATDGRLEQAKGKIVTALEDSRWTTRSVSRLRQIAGVSESELNEILRNLQVFRDGLYVGLTSRR